jgi:hypothetical protein
MVHASIFDDIAQGFMKIFSPLRLGNKDEWKGTDTPFTGKIEHHGEAGSRRPFKDGWTAQPQPTVTKKSEAMEEVMPAATGEESKESGNVVTFLNKAAENVVAHNFTGDKTEPATWKSGEQQAAGWSGDIHKRGKDGFHTSSK